MSSKKNIAIGCAAVFVVLVGGVLLLGGWAVVKLFDEADKASISPKTYRSVRVGQSAADVQALLPEGSTFMTEHAEKQGPKPPEDAVCRHFLSTEELDTMDTEQVFRFCFKDGKLVEKRTYEARI